MTPIPDPSGIVIEGAHAFIFSPSYMPEGGIELRRANYTGRGDADLEHVVWEKHTTVFPAGASPAWVHHRVPQVNLSLNWRHHRHVIMMLARVRR